MNEDKKILVVEDSGLQREICIHQLKELGFESVSGASDGLEACTFLESNAVDLIISDLEMPNMDGLDLLTKVKNDPKWKDIPVLLLTVYEDEASNKKFIEMGAFGYLIKPAPPEVLAEKLAHIFENKRKGSDRRAGDRRNERD